MKTLQEICTEADANKNDMQYLTNLWDYVQKRRELFKPEHREFIREHLNKYAKIIKDNERRKALRQQLDED